MCDKKEKLSLPIVDISPFCYDDGDEVVDEEKKLLVANKIHKICKNLGFLYVKGHGVPQELIDNIHIISRKFFELDQEEKEKIRIRPDSVTGYQTLGENVTKGKRDWHEAIDLYQDLTEEEIEEYSTLIKGGIDILTKENRWPEIPKEFKLIFHEYIIGMNKLGACIMKAIALGLGLEEDFFEAQYKHSPYWIMRTIGYPPLKDTEVKDIEESDDIEVGVSCGVHTDYGCLTILNQDSTKGALQVQTTSGDWINADPIPGCFVINIGDMIRIWTNGLYQSTPHRVVHKSSSFRVSIPFFYEPNLGTYVEPLLDLKDPDAIHEPVFSPIYYGDHLVGKVTKNFAFQHQQ